MKKRVSLTLIIVLGLFFATYAQHVIATSGGTMTSNAIQANWTIGELITETIFTSTSAVSAGLNQPGFQIITSVKKPWYENELSFYPNPVTQLMTVRYDGTLPIDIKIISVKGSVLSTNKIKEPLTQIDFSNVAAGIYVIQILKPEGMTSTYKIIKE
jgi:hypothetical protein